MHPNRATLFCSLAVILLGSLYPVAAQFPPQEDPRRLEIVEGPYGRLLTSGQETEIKVRVTDADGSPVAGLALTFLAPDRGPTGRFVEGEEARPYVRRAMTGEEGTAVARFRANETPGPYLLSILVDETLRSTTAAITNVADAQEFALSAERARQAAVEQLSTPMPERSLHGPVLLLPGTAVDPAGGGVFDKHLVGRPTWFFWIDGAPGAGHVHPTRFLFLDARDDTPDVANEARLTDELWWPVITLPGAQWVGPVRPPLGYVQDHGHLEPAAETITVAPQLGARLASAFRAEPDPGACAIVIYGSDKNNLELAFRTDANRMRFFLMMDLGVPSDQIFSPPDNRAAVRSDIDKLVAQAQAKNCKKVYFFFSGHGASGSMSLARESETAPFYDQFPYQGLAVALMPLASPDTRFCIIMLGCSSGSAIAAMQERGLSGEIVTDAGPFSLSRINVIRGKFFWDDFLKCWRGLRDTNSKNPTFREAYDWVLANGQKISLQGSEPGEGMPRFGVLAPQRKTATVPPVYIPAPGEMATATITLPKDITLPADMTRISVVDASVAGLGELGDRDFINSVFGAAQTTVELKVTGLKEGVTTYRFRSQDANGELIGGEALIVVGNAIGMEANESYLTGNGGVGRIVLPPGPARTLMVTHADEASRAIVEILFMTIEVPASETVRVETFGLRGLRPGTAKIMVTDKATGATQMVTVMVEGYFIPDVEVMVGEDKAAQATRSATLISPGFRTVRVIPFDDDASEFADVTPNDLAFAPNATQAPVLVRGKKVGSRRWLLIDRATGAQYIFKVNVTARVSCITPGRLYDYTAVAVQNPGGHQVSLLPASGTFTLIVTSNQIQLTGIGNLPALTGPLNPETCIATLAGSGTIAGRQTHVKLPLSYGSPTLAGFAVIGADGNLPGTRTFSQIAQIDSLPVTHDQVLNEVFINDASINAVNAFNPVCAAGAAGVGGMLVTPGAVQTARRAGPSPVEGYVTCLQSERTPATRAASEQPPPLLPAIPFEPNRGQAGIETRFLARGAGHTLLLADSEAVVVPNAAGARTVRIHPEGASAESRPRAGDRLLGSSHYFRGSDSKRWSTQVPHYASVRYDGVYPGVDLVYYGSGRGIEYDFVVQPGADPNRIRLRIDGSRGLRRTNDGGLEIRGAGGLTMRRPRVYQDTARGRVEIAGSYVTRGRNGVGFALGDYDRSLPLVIDPVLDFATYLGGGNLDFARAVAVDASGVYVAGFTASTDFSVRGGVQATNRGALDVFVTKLSRDGRQVLYSTYIGGNGIDTGLALAIDPAGNAYVAGQTNSTDFPVTPEAFQRTLGGGTCATAQNPNTPCADAFVFKLAPDGSRLLQSTYLGGNSLDGATSVAVDGTGSPYVAGAAFSANFPRTTGSVQSGFRGANACGPANARTACDDAYVTKLSPDFTRLIYSTYLGGTDRDQINGIAVDGGGNAVVVGTTLSPDFPVTAGAVQSQRRAGTCGTPPNTIACSDAFVSMINPAGSALVWSTYLGGDGVDQGQGVALDPSGSVFVVGSTAASNFPTTPGVVQGAHAGLFDVFITNIAPQGRSITRSTFLGGSGNDFGRAIGRAANGTIFVATDSGSNNFPGRPRTGTGVPILYEIRATPRP